MRVQSSETPEQIWIKYKEQDKACIRLRNNIETKVREEENSNSSTYYEYDEIEIFIPLQPDLEQYLYNNFNTLWDMHTPEGIYNLKLLLADLTEEVLMTQ